VRRRSQRGFERRNQRRIVWLDARAVAPEQLAVTADQKFLEIPLEEALVFDRRLAGCEILVVRRRAGFVVCARVLW